MSFWKKVEQQAYVFIAAQTRKNDDKLKIIERTVVITKSFKFRKK